jgi:hypothetical protein
MGKNKVIQNEVKEIIYQPTRQYFSEISSTGGVRDSHFRIPERKQKVIHTKDQTIVILGDGSKGVAKCSNRDEYDKVTGIKVAYLRAKIASLQKELNSLCGGGISK